MKKTADKLTILALLILGQTVHADCNNTNIFLRESTLYDSLAIDQLTTFDRDHVIQYSSHRNSSAQSLFNNLYHQSRNWEGMSEDQIIYAGVQIRSYLQSISTDLESIRSDMDRILAMHRQQPFEFIALEVTTEDMDDGDVSYNIEMAVELRSHLRQHMVGFLSEQDIDNLLLHLLGDEMYLLLPGQPLADLPRYAIESAEIKNGETPLLDACSQSFQQLGQIFDGTPVHGSLVQVFQSLMGNGLSLNRQSFLQARTDFIAVAVENLQDRGVSAEDSRPALEERLHSCEVMFSTRRDQFAARRLLEDLPTGRGLVTRGTIHRDRLNTAWLNHCNSGGVTSKDRPADEATE